MVVKEGIKYPEIWEENGKFYAEFDPDSCGPPCGWEDGPNPPVGNKIEVVWIGIPVL